ncbi:EhaG family protein [Methanocaldococcus infernus]
MYSLTIFIGFVVGILSLLAISFQNDKLHSLILTDLVECAMLIIIAAVGTDLAEALILPGLVVGLAELLAVSEILLVKTRIKKKKTKSLDICINMEVLRTAPKFLALVLIVYGSILTGFTGGALIATGLLFYAFSRRHICSLDNLYKFVWEGLSGLSGIAWACWIIGFLGFFLFPKYWLSFLLMAGIGLVIKVGSKMGLVGLAEEK